MANPPAAAAGVLFLPLALLLLLQAAQGASAPGSLDSYVPVSGVVYGSAATAHEPFKTCSGCRCCPPAAVKDDGENGSSSCVETRCCYGINCNVPGKPFGVCAFTPRSCGCGAGGNCTA